MLPAERRLSSAPEFRRTARRGRRATSPRLVVHVAARGGEGRVGLVVPRSVGGAVVRNRVKRRLRHLLRERLELVPAEGTVVVRALPGSARATSADLGHDLSQGLRQASS